MKKEASIIVELACIAGVFIFVLGGAYLVNLCECYSKAKALEYQCDYKPFQGCLLIKPDGKRVLLEQLRDFDN